MTNVIIRAESRPLPESRDLAVHGLSAVQGAGVLVQAFHDPRYVVREGNRLKEWVRSLQDVLTASALSARSALDHGLYLGQCFAARSRCHAQRGEYREQVRARGDPPHALKGLVRRRKPPRVPD
jgi:hypothetical protein